MRRVILHIGTHKTGTTSFQAYLKEHRKALRRQGIHTLPLNPARMMAAACIREGCPIPPVKTLGDVDRDALARECRQTVEAFLARHEDGTFLITSEHFSYFRTPDECRRLAALIPSGTPISIVVAFRPEAEFLSSYRAQILKKGHGVSDDPASPYYCEPDSWLADYDSLLAAYRAVFDDIVVLPYDAEDMVGRLLSTVGARTPRTARGFRRNVTGAIEKPPSAAARIVRWLRGRGR